MGRAAARYSNRGRSAPGATSASVGHAFASRRTSGWCECEQQRRAVAPPCTSCGRAAAFARRANTAFRASGNSRQRWPPHPPPATASPSARPPNWSLAARRSRALVASLCAIRRRRRSRPGYFLNEAGSRSARRTRYRRGARTISACPRRRRRRHECSSRSSQGESDRPSSP